MSTVPPQINLQSAIDRCRRLVEEINAASEACGAFAAQPSWRSTDGTPVYDNRPTDPSTVDENFLRQLRLDRQIFTGQMPDKSARRVPSIVPSRLAFLFLGFYRLYSFVNQCLAASRRAPLDSSVLAFAAAARGLPKDYIVKMPPDNGGLRLGCYLINGEAASYQERLRILYASGVLDRLKNCTLPVIVEIGGGFGALAHCIKRILPRAAYVIVDLPRSLVHSGCWLAQWTTETICTYRPGQTLKPGFFLIPHLAFRELNAIRIDLAINTLSFGEMPEATVASYAEQIASLLAPDGVLFEQNFDNTHYSHETFCDPAKAISKHFRYRRTIDGIYGRGVPSLWWNEIRS